MNMIQLLTLRKFKKKKNGMKTARRKKSTRRDVSSWKDSKKKE
jgi:hypothetical protein